MKKQIPAAISHYLPWRICMAGPGKIQSLDVNTNTLELLFYNFDVNQSQLKPEHEEWLKYAVIPYLKRGGSVAMGGLASRTGSAEHNKGLSQRRIDSVLSSLRRESPNFAVRVQIALGESGAEIAGARDNSEDERWRGVLLSVWVRPSPPPPPPIPQRSAPEPVMVERRVYANFIWKFTMKGGTAGDPRSAPLISDAITQHHFGKVGGRYVSDWKMPVPASHVPHEIMLFPGKETVNFGVAKNTTLYAEVYYRWGQRRSKRPYCLLIDYMGQQLVPKSNPVIWLLTEAQADEWVRDPFRARAEMRSDPYRRVPYGDYHSGKY
jgi:hypothetical protein